MLTTVMSHNLYGNLWLLIHCLHPLWRGGVHSVQLQWLCRALKGPLGKDRQQLQNRPKGMVFCLGRDEGKQAQDC